MWRSAVTVPFESTDVAVINSPRLDAPPSRAIGRGVLITHPPRRGALEQVAQLRVRKLAQARLACAHHAARHFLLAPGSSRRSAPPAAVSRPPHDRSRPWRTARSRRAQAGLRFRLADRQPAVPELHISESGIARPIGEPPASSRHNAERPHTRRRSSCRLDERQQEHWQHHGASRQNQRFYEPDAISTRHHQLTTRAIARNGALLPAAA
jgi:hypothetical protein